MNLAELQRKLIAAARANPPSDHVPGGFEQRVMARLQERPARDEWALWARALWRAAAACAVVMLLLGAWSAIVPDGSPASGDLSQAFDNAVLAAADQEQSPDSIE